MKTKLLMVAMLLFIAMSYAQKTYVPDNNFEQALIDLGYDDVLDDYVTTANISSITSLNVSNKNITDLTGIEAFIVLKKLYCSNNQLTDLDLSKHEYLYVLDCSSNKLVSLNIKNGKFSKGFSLKAQNNPDLTCITSDPYAEKYLKNIDSQTSFSTDCKGIYKGLTYLPFDGYEQKLIDLGYDNVLDNYVLTSEIEKITEFSVFSRDNTGLEDFVNLRSLDLSLHYFYKETLDLSKMIHLEKLDVHLNRASMPDISKNLALKELKVNTNDTNAGLNLKDHLALEKLSVSNNARGTTSFLDLSNHTKLKEVSINKVKGLNLSNCTALESVRTTNCSEGINLTNCTALKSLEFGHIGSYFSSLDLSTCTALESLSIENNGNIESLDLSKNTNLKSLRLYELRKLESLNLKNGNNTNLTLEKVGILPALKCVTVDDVAYSTANWSIYNITFSEDCSVVELTYVPDNNFEQTLIDLGYDTVLDDYVPTANISSITNLDVSDKNIADLTGIEAFLALEQLNVANNNIENLNLSNNLALIKIRCEYNELSTETLNLSKNTLVKELICYENQFTTIDVSHMAELEKLWLEGNTNLTSINVNGLEKLVDLRFTKSNVSEIDVTTNTALKILRCKDNSLTNLDVSKNTALSTLICTNNSLTSLNVKNGNNNYMYIFDTKNNTGLSCITVDDAIYSTAKWTFIDSHTTFSEDCSGAVLATDSFDLKGLVIYPNPVQNKLQIRIEEEANYALVNMNGQIIFKGKITIGENLLDVSRLANGVYYLNIKTENISVSKKVIKY